MQVETLAGKAVNLRLEVEESAAYLTLIPTRMHGRSACGNVNLTNLKSVLSGTKLHLSIGGWLCSFEKIGSTVQASVMLDDLDELVDCWSSEEFAKFISPALEQSHSKVEVDPRFSMF